MRLFAYRLAKDLGWAGPIRGFLAQFSSSDLEEWMAFYTVEAEQRQENEMAADAVRGASDRLEQLRQTR